MSSSYDQHEQFPAGPPEMGWRISVLKMAISLLEAAIPNEAAVAPIIYLDDYRDPQATSINSQVEQAVEGRDASIISLDEQRKKRRLSDEARDIARPAEEVKHVTETA